MVELAIHRQDGNRLPRRGGVARLASTGKSSVVGIAVTVAATIKRQAFPTRIAAGLGGGVASFAGRFNVGAGEQKMSLAVIEVGYCFPVVDRVALLTLLSELSLVLVRVARDAGRRKTQVGAIQVLDANTGAFQLGDVGGSVALGAIEAGVLAFQGPACLAVVELAQRRLPLDQREAFPIVLGMATGAGLAAGIFGDDAGVIALAGCDPLGNFGVAVEALEAGLTAQAMALGAVGGAAQGAVSLGKGSGGNLRRSYGRQYESIEKQCENCGQWN